MGIVRTPPLTDCSPARVDALRTRVVAFTLGLRVMGCDQDVGVEVPLALVAATLKA